MSTLKVATSTQDAPTDPQITGAQCRAARGLLGMTQRELATQARIYLRTLQDFESGKREPLSQTLVVIAGALERAGVVFIPENGGGAGVRFRERAK
jgi:transcriptional regulator with XRE-family HTH domain